MQQKKTPTMLVDADIAELFRKALQHYKKGHLQQAQVECLALLQKRQHPDAIFMLGLIAHQQREFEVAVEHYQQFLRIKPDHAQTHYNLGVVLEELGHTERAIGHFNQSITTTGDNAAVHSQLADAYSKLQRWELAIKAYQQVLAIDASDVVTIIKLGNVFFAAKVWTQAIPRYEQALAIQPDNILVHKNLGSAHHKVGQWVKAIKCFEQALSLRPDYADARFELAQVLRELGRAEEALVQLEQLIDLKPDDADALISLADTLRDLGQAELAIERLEQFLHARPTCGAIYYHISMIKPKQALIAVVEKLISDPGLPDGDAIYCHFALGNLFKHGQLFDQAFSHFLKANTLHRKTFSYDPKEITLFIDRMIKVYSEGFFQGKHGWGSASMLPVFVVGMHRSGTTLVEQILSSHALVHGAGELQAIPAVHFGIGLQLKYANPYPECMSLFDEKMAEEYSAHYLQELALHSPTAMRITDKAPINFLQIGLIKTLFPDARIVHCQRNPLDSCISLLFHYFQNQKYSFELTELGQYYLDYQRIMSHWQKLFPGEIFTVQYEELVLDQERVSKQLIDYLGLEWDEKCLDFHNNERVVMTPSNIQVRQPMYKESMNRWKPYERHLQPLIEMLQQTL
jgi:tetratricopeptide (TPR) repeat protein